MQLSTVDQIQRAISQLSAEDRKELFARLEDEADECLKSAVEAGRFDDLIDAALEDRKNGRLRPL